MILLLLRYSFLTNTIYRKVRFIIFFFLHLIYIFEYIWINACFVDKKICEKTEQLKKNTICWKNHVPWEIFATFLFLILVEYHILNFMKASRASKFHKFVRYNCVIILQVMHLSFFVFFYTCWFVHGDILYKNSYIYCKFDLGTRVIRSVCQKEFNFCDCWIFAWLHEEVPLKFEEASYINLHCSAKLEVDDHWTIRSSELSWGVAPRDASSKSSRCKHSFNIRDAAVYRTLECGSLE